MSPGKKERFKDVFPPRVKRIEKMLETLGNCSAKNNYEWNERQSQTMRLAHSCASSSNAPTLFGVTVTAQVDGIEVRTID